MEPGHGGQSQRASMGRSSSSWWCVAVGAVAVARLQQAGAHVADVCLLPGLGIVPVPEAGPDTLGVRSFVTADAAGKQDQAEAGFAGEDEANAAAPSPAPGSKRLDLGATLRGAVRNALSPEALASRNHSPFVQPFFQLSQARNCSYNQQTPDCVLGSILPQMSPTGFGDAVPCRGNVHWFVVYFVSVSLGLDQMHAYFLASFSQSIDYLYYDAVDSCGSQMGDAWSTPPMRGMQRTNVMAGGTFRHLGLPYIGHYNGTTLSAADKTYRGGLSGQCVVEHFEKPYSFYNASCPALSPNMTDPFYDGALASAKQWAFMETDQLCTGGFTALADDGSPFFGTGCPESGEATSMNVTMLVEGPIPLGGGAMRLGEQLLNYDCLPACACNSTCANSTENDNYEKVNVVYAHQLQEYLANNTQYAVLNNGTVPQEIARIGIFTHWVADRASHWFCTDAPATGISILNVTDAKNYQLGFWMSSSQCNFIRHGLVHQYEQGGSGAGPIAPGSYSAIVSAFNIIEEWANKFRPLHPEWFNPAVKPLSFAQVVGTDSAPGALYNVTVERFAAARVQMVNDYLKQFGLPLAPGLETACPAAAAR